MSDATRAGILCNAEMIPKEDVFVGRSGKFSASSSLSGITSSFIAARCCVGCRVLTVVAVQSKQSHDTAFCIRQLSPSTHYYYTQGIKDPYMRAIKRPKREGLRQSMTST
jgi:hypothetical protein